MFLAWTTHNKKHILILVLGISGNKIIALKVQEPPNSQTLSNHSINSIRSSIIKLNKLDLKDRVSEIRHLIREFKRIYRTYDANKLNIIQKFDLQPL